MRSSSKQDAGHQNRFDARISGRVQGVGFRAFVVRKGRGMGLTGFVRNNHDGTVDVTACGRKSDLEAFYDYLSAGPVASRVDDIEIRWSRDDNPLRTFDVRR
jgi:acylphosphatase